MPAIDAEFFPLPTETMRAKRSNAAALRLILILFIIAVVVSCVLRAVSWSESTPDAALLTLVNAEHPLPEAYRPELCTLPDGQQIDRRCYNDLTEMLRDCREAGCDACVLSAYRAAAAGTSEHSLGLAADIADAAYPYLDKTQETTPAQQWLTENSWQYGFILRYPEAKADVTGVPYEPWHYRYVGREAARQLHELGVCLEEYLSLFY